MKRLALVVLPCLVAVAHADTTTRFGLTFGVDHNAPKSEEYGPMFALGARLGAFTGEVSYTYLSFFDFDSSIHRFGVALRSDLLRNMRERGWTALYGELGASQRFGTWRVDEMSPYEPHRQSELHAALGYELAENDNAWQLAVRFGIARRDPSLEVACRGTECASTWMPRSSGLAESVMVEWMWLLGH